MCIRDSLNTLSKVEIREFKKFLQSPLHNQRKDVSLLLDYILEQKSTDKPLPEKAIIQQRLFPTISFNLTNFDLLISYLFRLLQDYLAWKNWQADKHNVQFHTAQNLAKRGVQLIAKNSFDLLKKDLVKKPLRDADYFFKLQQIQWAEHQLTDTCLLYTSPSPRDATLSRMPSSA